MFSSTNRVSGANHYKCNSYDEAVAQFRAAEAEGIVEKR